MIRSIEEMTSDQLFTHAYAGMGVAVGQLSDEQLDKLARIRCGEFSDLIEGEIQRRWMLRCGPLDQRLVREIDEAYSLAAPA